MRLFKGRTLSKGIPGDSSTPGVVTPKTSKKGGTQSHCWEVVDHMDIAPILTVSYPNDEFLTGDAMLRLGRQDMSRTYVFYIRPNDNQHRKELTQQAVIFARRQLLTETRRYGFNSFIQEGWVLTLFRNSNRWRIEVRYTARPAFMAGKFQSHTPPFLEMLV